MKQDKPKKKYYEKVLNLENLNNLSLKKLRAFVTSNNCLVMYSVLICLLMHFVGISNSSVGGIILTVVMGVIFVLMLIFSVVIIILDAKNKVFKNRFIAPIFVTFFLLITIISSISAYERSKFTVEGDVVTYHIDLVLLFGVYTPLYIISITLSCLFFINHMTMVWKMKKAYLKQNSSNLKK